jgi:hypothetical protein
MHCRPEFAVRAHQHSPYFGVIYASSRRISPVGATIALFLQSKRRAEMKKLMPVVIVAVLTGLVPFAAPAVAQVSQEVIDSISTPNEVETSIGALKFLDGAPLPETAEKVYDYLDTARAADAFMKGMPGASVAALMEGAHSIGAVEAHEVMIFDKLMGAESLFLTGNSSTVYCIPDLDLKRDGPTVVEIPDGLLGAANDGWFRFINNYGVSGKYLYLPPGDVPDLVLPAVLRQEWGRCQSRRTLHRECKGLSAREVQEPAEDEVRQRLGQGLQHDPPEQHRVLPSPRQDHPV